jgi:hypothetical protein
MDQPQPHLMIESPDIRDNRLGLLAQHAALAQHLRIGILIVERRRRIPLRNPPVDLRVPGGVVDAVEDPTELVSVDVQRVSKAGALIGVARLPGVLRRHGRHEVRIDDPALERMERRWIEVILQPRPVEEACRLSQPNRPQHPLRCDALMSEIMNAPSGVHRRRDALTGCCTRERQRSFTKLPSITRHAPACPTIRLSF